MPALKLEQFGGAFPAWHGTLLPQGQASYAKNGFLFSGALIGWRKPKLLRALNDTAARKVFRVPTVTEAQARAYLVFKAQPSPGDTVAVGDLTYTFVAALVTSLDVLIGADAGATATNLANALTADSGENTNAGVTYGENTPLNGAVRYFLPDSDPVTGQIAPTVTQDVVDSATIYTILAVGAEDFGAAYNLIRLTESSGDVRLTWLYDTTSFTHTTSTFRGGQNATFANTILGPSAWMEFKDRDTDVIKSPVIEDQFDRFYFASPSEPPQYNTRERIAAGDDPWLLGVPPPGCAVTLDITGGGNDLTLGNFTAADGEVEAKANRVYLIPVTAPGATQIQNVTIIGSALGMPDGGFPDAHWAAVLYSDFGGKPDQLMNTGQIITGLVSDNLNVSTFVNPTNLSADTDYWLGIMLDAPIHSFNGGPVGQAFDMVSWPNTFTNGPNLTAPTTVLAHSQITSDGTNVIDGTVMTIGLTTYTFQDTIGAGTATDVRVHIGVNAAATLVNLEHAINASGGTAGTDYNASAVANHYVSAGAPVALAIELTLRDAALGDGSNVVTTFNGLHLTFPDNTLQAGYTSGQADFQMYASCITSDVIESRAYVYTWVSVYGEEGPPSPPTLLDGWSNGTWTLGLWQPPPNDLGVLRDLRKINIYRTVPGQGGNTVFFFVEAVDIGTTTYVDTIPDNTVALNDQLASTTWFPPPETLQGLTVMQNGMVAGFRANEVWFCEPYHPHAWPAGYVLTVDFPIIGLGVTQGALVVCTSANPFVISGQAPAQMGQVKCAQSNPCSSRPSILSGDEAVTYCGPNGLIQVTSNGVANNTTDSWITREKWRQLTPQHDAAAVVISSCYFCLGTVSADGLDASVAQTGFTVELNQDNSTFTIWPQPGGHRVGFETLDSPVDADIQGLMIDPWTSTALVVANGNVYYYDFGDLAPSLKTVTWRSKFFQQNAVRNYSAMKAYFTVPPNTATQNPTRLTAVASDPAWDTLPADRYAFIKCYVDLNDDGNFTLVDAREVRKNGEVLRIIDGFKGNTWMFELQSRVNISNVQIATSVKELAQV